MTQITSQSLQKIGIGTAEKMSLQTSAGSSMRLVRL